MLFSKTLPAPEGNGRALVRADDVYAPVPAVSKLPAHLRSVRMILKAFETKREEGDDYELLVDAYMMALEGFEAEVIVAMAKSMLTDNPRNPFRPSPQDMMERCKKIRGGWRAQIMFWLWGNLERGVDPYGPDAQCSSVLADKIVTEFAKDEERGWAQMSDDDFARWPVRLLKQAGVYEKTLEVRADYKARHSKEDAELAARIARCQAEAAARESQGGPRPRISDPTALLLNLEAARRRDEQIRQGRRQREHERGAQDRHEEQGEAQEAERVRRAAEHAEEVKEVIRKVEVARATEPVKLALAKFEAAEAARDKAASKAAFDELQKAAQSHGLVAFDFFANAF